MEKLFISQEATDNTQITFCGEGWSYEAALKEQLAAYDQVCSEDPNFKILSGVHAPVYTLGNSLKEKPVTKSSLSFVKTDRGGQLMYHGPGQLTLYPIFKLTNFFAGPREYSKYIFDTCIDHFKTKHGLDLVCKKNGLWFKDKKVGFLGLRIKNGIVYHGLSLNYLTDLEAFKEHSPCDISGDQAGNIFTLNDKRSFSLKDEAFELAKSIAHKLTI